MRSIDVLIVTAARGEDEAARLVEDGAVGRWEETDGPEGFGFTVWHRSYRTRHGRIMRVALTRAAFKGTDTTAHVAGRLVDAYEPRCLAMCGVCAGRPGRTNLGDVIIADRVYRYDTGAIVVEVVDGRRVERLKPDTTTFQISAQWKLASENFRISEDATWLKERPRRREFQANWLLNELGEGRNPSRSSGRGARCPDWPEVIDELWTAGLLAPGKVELTEAGFLRVEALRNRYPDGLPEPEPFRIHAGPLATGSSVIKVPDFFERLADQQRDVLGLDMEASAVGLTAHMQEVPRMIVVKGVLDHANPEKADRFRSFAARAAAEVLIGFLREHLDPRSLGAANILGPNTLAATTNENPATLLNARYERVAFVEGLRRGEIDDLEGWCADPAPVRARLFIGPGGTGKTRLFIEWCKRIRERGWHAGFLAGQPTEDAANVLLAADGPVCVVIDYAESRPRLMEFLRCLARRSTSGSGSLRVVLLARAAADWWRSLLESDDEVRHVLTEREPTPLGLVSVQGDLRQQIFQQARGAFARILGRERGAGREPGLDDPRFGRVLYLHVAALAAVEELETEAPTLMAAIVHHEQRFWVRRFWEPHAGDDLGRAEFVSAARRAVAALTLRGGATSRTEAEVTIERVRGPAEPHFVRFLKGLYPGREGQQETGRYLAGLEPDLLGEHLVASVLLDGETPADYLDRVFGEATDDALLAGFAMLGRMSLRYDGASAWIAGILEADVHARARAALHAAMTLGEETALSPIGWVLAQALDRHGTPALAQEIVRIVPEHTVSLREVATWATRKLLEALPAGGDPSSAEERARLLNNLGNRLSELGRREEALAATREAVERYRALAAQQPDAFLPDLAMSLNNLGAMLSELGEREEALAATREAVEHYRALAAQRPDTFLPYLAGGLNNLGAPLSELGRREEALAATREAVEIRRALAAARPDAFLPDLAMSLNNLGGMLSELGRQEEALAALLPAVEVYCQLVEQWPAAFSRNLLISLRSFARLLDDQERETHPTVKRAMTLLRELRRDDEGSGGSGTAG